MEQKVTNVSLNENLMQLHALNSNVVAQYGYGVETGTFDVDFVLSNPWWLDLIFTLPGGQPTGAGAPYTYTYTAIPPKSVQTFTAEMGTAFESANQQRQFNGSILTGMKLSSRIGDFIRCTASCAYALEKNPVGTSLNGSPPSDSLTFPYTFEYAYIQVPNGTTLAEVQSFDMNINPNQQFIWGMNNKTGVNTWRGLCEFSGRFNLATKDSTWLTNVLARSEMATATFVFDNGLGGASQKKLTMTFAGVGLNTHSTSYNPNELILEDVPLVFRQPSSIVAINPVSATP